MNAAMAAAIAGAPLASTPFEQRCNTRGKVLAEVIWLGDGVNLRSKTFVLDSMPAGPEDCPTWTVEGSIHDQATALCSVLYLKARAIYADPFRAGNHILVLCDIMSPPKVESDGKVAEPMPHPTNNRVPAAAALSSAAGIDPTFTVEQQYMLLDPETRTPLGWPKQYGSVNGKAASRFPASQHQPPEAQSLGIVGAAFTAGRHFSEAHLRACLHAGLDITATQAGTVPGQWSYTIGPCRGISLGDQLWMSRYLLHRVSEQYNVIVTLDPKPVPGNWSGNGAPITFSSCETRDTSKGWFAVQAHVRLLAGSHMQHMMVYGCGNNRRLTGRDNTSNMMAFTWGLENKAASVSIPHAVLLQRAGGYEDRRPAANCDPYLVTMMLVCTTSGLPLPSLDQVQQEEATSGSEALSADILYEMDVLEAFAPDTPPQGLDSLATEASSDNFADFLAHVDDFSEAAAPIDSTVHGGGHFLMDGLFA